MSRSIAIVLAAALGCLSLSACVVAPAPGVVVARPAYRVWVPGHCGYWGCRPGYWAYR